MIAHDVVIETARGFWVGEGEPSRDFLTGFLRGHRDGEVGLQKGDPKKESQVYQIAYSGGYEYARRIVAPHEKRVQKVDKKGKK